MTEAERQKKRKAQVRICPDGTAEQRVEVEPEQERCDGGCKAAVLDNGWCSGCGLPSFDPPPQQDQERCVNLAAHRKQVEAGVRERLLDAMEKARQGNVGTGWCHGDLFEGRTETEMTKDGVQVVALDDFNAALDTLEADRG